MEILEVVKEASTAFVEQNYQTACYKYKTALNLISTLNISNTNNELVVIKYMLCKTLLESNVLENILQALETLIELKKCIGNSFPAVYYALGKAYIKLYRFNSALNAVNRGLAISNAGIRFQQFCIPMTSITIQESTKEGLLVALMNLHDEASSWHCPDAKCYVEACQNYVPHCSPSRDIFCRDPALTGLVVVTCSNTINPCKFKFHPVCWDFYKKQICSVMKLSDKEIIGHLCFNEDCKNNNVISIITKVEVFDSNEKIISAIEKSSPAIEPMSNPPVKGAIKKYTPQPFPKLRRPNLPHRSSPQTICSEEQPLEEDLEKETRLAKLIKLRETSFNTSHGQYLEPDKDKHENKNLDSTTDIISDLAFKDNVETIQQCRFIFEILHEFIKSNVMVHIDKVLLKWHETRQIMEYVKDIDEYLDSDIMELLLKSSKFIKIGNYICIPETLEQTLQMFEREIIEQCKSVLQVKSHKGNGDSQPAVNEIISHKKIITNFENQTNQSSQRLLCSTNNVNENNNNIFQSSNMDETSINFIKNNSQNEVKTNTLSQSKNICDWNIERNSQISSMENENKRDCNISQKDKSFIDCNDMKRNNQNLTDSMAQDNSQNSTKYSFSKENTIKNVSDNNFIKQSPNDDLSSKLTVLQEEYAQLMNNYSTMEQSLIKLTKEKANMERNFKLELEKKNSIMEAIIDERKILIKKLETYESHIAEDIPVQCEALNKHILALKAEISRLKQEKLDNEHNINVLLKEKTVAENTVEKSNVELLETMKQCQAEVDKKNTELITFQEKNLELKKSMLLKSLESQYYCNQSILSTSMKHCQVALEIFDNLNHLTKQHFGFNIISNYTAWLQALNCLQAQHTKMEGDFSQFKSLLESKAEVEKIDKVVLNSINLPPYPSRSIGATICDAFMTFYAYIPKIPQQGIALYTPPPLLVNPHMLPYINPPQFPNKSNVQQTQKHNVPAKSVNSNTNSTQLISELEKKHLTNEHQNISQNSDLNKESNEGIQNNLQPTNNNEEVQCDLKGNENNLDDKKNLKDNNQIVEEINTNGTSSTYMINSDVPNTLNENKLLFNSNDVSDNTGCTFLSESKIEEAMEEEKIENTKEESNKILINSTDKIMSILRSKYTGMSDFLLLKSLNDLRITYNGTLTGMPLDTIMQNVDKYVLSHQIDHLCTYDEITKTVKNTATVSKGSKMSTRQKVKNKPTSNSIKSRPLLKDVTLTKPLVKKDQLSGAIKQVPVNLTKCPWDIILKPGTNQNNYGESECVICMESLLTINKLIYTLDCQHKFHKTCIKEWFQKNQSCPTCRIHCTIDEEYPPLP